MAWIWIAVAAALFQTLRFMLQKMLAQQSLSTGGATLSRFLFSAPWAVALSIIYVTWRGQGWPGLGERFWSFALMGAVSQILATWCVVALFATRHFAVGITFKKTEVMMTALAGFVILGDHISLPGFGAMALGLIGVWVLSPPPKEGVSGWQNLANRATGLGLLSGVFFALSAVGYRGATLAVDSSDPLIRSLMSLGIVTTVQMLGLMTYLFWREPGEVGRVIGSWRTSFWAGITSLGGSLGWFTAFTLQNAAYVFAVGQVEVIFSLLIGWAVFKERVTGREFWGISLIVISVIALVAFR